MRWMTATLVALIAMAVTANPTAAALVINGYSAATAGKYDRFANNPAFIGNAYDWSGVGRTTNGHWGVLISPSFVLSSRHFPPSVAEQFRFYPSNDPTAGFVQKSIVSNSIIANSDLVLTRLGSSTVGLATYAVGHPATNLVGKELFVWGQANNPDTYLNTRLGRNVVTGILPNYTSANLVGRSDVMVFDYDTTVRGLGDDEAMVAGNDSGGPSFTIGPNGPELVGVHWFMYDAAPPNQPPGSGDTLVTSLINQINSAMAATGSLERVTVAVPEPGGLGLVLAGLSLVFVRRRQMLA